jgi:hypothetical protein
VWAPRPAPAQAIGSASPVASRRVPARMDPKELSAAVRTGRSGRLACAAIADAVAECALRPRRHGPLPWPSWDFSALVEGAAPFAGPA